MKIYIEASSLYGQQSGVGRYNETLFNELVKIRSEDQFVFFNFQRPNSVVKFNIANSKNIKTKHIRWFPGRVFSFLMRRGLSLPMELFGIRGADVVVFPNFISWASITQQKRISIVHDVAFLKYPNFVEKKNLKYLKTQLLKSIRRSSKVIAVSDFTKSEVIKKFHIEDGLVDVVYTSADRSFFYKRPKNEIARILLKHNLPPKYLLFVGNVEPRKNIVNLLKAYAESFEKYQIPLVVVGAKGWRDSDIKDLASTIIEQGKPIYFTGFVEDNDLPALYSGAEIFLFPSLYEGFGIPVLEAMLCECPVIASNVSSLPEITNGAALLVNPKDASSIRLGIESFLKNENLKKKYSKNGLARARSFSAFDNAKKFSKIIDSVLN